MNKRLIVGITALLWVAVAMGTIVSKQYILTTGKTIMLETVPVDPRDFLRGDYVVLRYKISALDLTRIKSAKAYYHSGERIFVELVPKDKFWEAAAVDGKKDAPAGRVILAGRVKFCYQGKLEVTYGIESYFVPEGEGKEIEKKMRGRESFVSVEVVVDPAGRALIKKVYTEK